MHNGMANQSTPESTLDLQIGAWIASGLLDRPEAYLIFYNWTDRKEIPRADQALYDELLLAVTKDFLFRGIGISKDFPLPTMPAYKAMQAVAIVVEFFDVFEQAEILQILQRKAQNGHH